MKPLNLALALLSATLLSAPLLSQTQMGQTMPGLAAPEAAPIPGPTYSQIYCSGFITRAAVPRDSFVLGSKESPNEDRFQGRSTIFLRGPDLAVGTRYSLIRQVADPNRENSSLDQQKARQPWRPIPGCRLAHRPFHYRRHRHRHLRLLLHRRHPG